MDNDFNTWRKKGKHLPEFLRDFHDQKDFFKFLHESIGPPNSNGLTKDINWVEGHIYTIDTLLHVLSAYGYTLQKSRAKHNFKDLESAIKNNKDARSAAFTKALLGNTSHEKDK